LSMHAVVAFGLPPAETPGVKCNCYRLDDMCPAGCPGCRCDPGKGGMCDVDGKLDVNCTKIPDATPQPNPAKLVQALDLYLQAYMVPVSNGEGRPDASLFDAAARVKVGKKNSEMHRRLRATVHAALDAVIGFDFSLPRIANTRRSAALWGAGNVRHTPPESVDIVEAAHQGLRNAILNRNLNAVVEPLTTFWTANPDFHPFHTGRYYEHGHPEYARTTPLGGQILVLKQSLRGLMNDGQPLCGNEVREGAEACDGIDNAACNGVACGTDCSCTIIP